MAELKRSKGNRLPPASMEPKGDWPFGRLARKSDRDLETPQLNSE
jgi:hypothetical protein